MSGLSSRRRSLPSPRGGSTTPARAGRAGRGGPGSHRIPPRAATRQLRVETLCWNGLRGSLASMVQRGGGTPWTPDAGADCASGGGCRRAPSWRWPVRGRARRPPSTTSAADSHGRALHLWPPAGGRRPAQHRALGASPRWAAAARGSQITGDAARRRTRIDKIEKAVRQPCRSAITAESAPRAK